MEVAFISSHVISAAPSSSGGGLLTLFPVGPSHGVQSFRDRLLQRGSPTGSQTQYISLKLCEPWKSHCSSPHPPGGLALRTSQLQSFVATPLCFLGSVLRYCWPVRGCHPSPASGQEGICLSPAMMGRGQVLSYYIGLGSQKGRPFACWSLIAGCMVEQQSCDTTLNPAATLVKSLKPDFGSNTRNPGAREPQGYMFTFLSLSSSPVTQQNPTLR